MGDSISRSYILTQLKHWQIANASYEDKDAYELIGVFMRMVEQAPEVRQKPITEQLQALAENICENYCQYRGTVDDDALCDIIRDGGDCPLDVI